jgi:hypothetical protein
MKLARKRVLRQFIVPISDLKYPVQLREMAMVNTTLHQDETPNGVRWLIQKGSWEWALFLALEENALESDSESNGGDSKEAMCSVYLGPTEIPAEVLPSLSRLSMLDLKFSAELLRADGTLKKRLTETKIAQEDMTQGGRERLLCLGSFALKTSLTGMVVNLDIDFSFKASCAGRSRSKSRVSSARSRSRFSRSGSSATVTSANSRRALSKKRKTKTKP